MSERTFLDTNVLVNVFDHDAPEKRERARKLLAETGRTGLGVVSTQVLQEIYVAVTRQLGRPLSHAKAERVVNGLAALPIVAIDVSTVLAAVARAGSLSISLWDALILQAAIESGCSRLLTEDLQDGRVVEGVRIENPFRN